MALGSPTSAPICQDLPAQVSAIRGCWRVDRLDATVEQVARRSDMKRQILTAITNWQNGGRRYSPPLEIYKLGRRKRGKGRHYHDIQKLHLCTLCPTPKQIRKMHRTAGVETTNANWTTDSAQSKPATASSTRIVFANPSWFFI